MRDNDSRRQTAPNIIAMLCFLLGVGGTAHAQITSLSASPSSMTLYVTWRWHETKLTAQTPGGPVNVSRSVATWTTSNPSVATVSAQGIITANAPGNATISATYSGFTANQTITVISPVLPPVHETPDPFLTTPASGSRDEVRVLIMRYLPTLNGVDLDVNNLPDFYWLNPGTLTTMKNTLTNYDIRAKFILEEGSKFRGYNNPSAPPALGYRVVDLITVYEPTPPGPTLVYDNGRALYGADYHAIASRFNWQHYVNTLGVKEIWFWGGGPDPGYPSYNPATMDSINFRTYPESNMSSPTTGDISNSYRIPDDLPIYNNTYVLYGYNPRRTQAEAIHNHGHQLEAMFSHVSYLRDGNTEMFWKKFVGQDANSNFITGRCGWTHSPPNTTAGYDYANTAQVLSDIEDWRPDNSGTKKLVSKSTWENIPYQWPPTGTIPQQIESHWYIYWMQSMPGCGNTIPHGSRYMSNWWKFIADWDLAIQSGYGLHMPTPDYCPVPTPSQVVLLQPASQSVLTSIAPILRWRRVASALTYRLQVASDSLFTSIVSNQTGLTDTLLSISLSCGSRFFWRVQGSNAAGPGPWSDTWSFTTAPSPSLSVTAPARVCANDSVWITLTLTGTPPFHVEYSMNGMPGELKDYAANVHTIAFAPLGNVQFTVTSGGDVNCSLQSIPAPIQVQVDTRPAAQIIGPTSLCAGDTLHARLNLSGTPPFELQYSLNGLPTIVSGLNSNQYMIDMIPQSATTLRLLSVKDANCASTLNDSLVVTYSERPNKTITVSGPLRFCEGGSVVLRADGSGACLWSTGETTDSIIVRQTGWYHVTVTNAQQCTSVSAPLKVEVLARPASTITASKPPMLCQGDSVVLDAGVGFASYAWSTGAVTRTITVHTTGDYFVTVTNIDGCAATSQNQHVQVDSLRIPEIRLTGKDVLCDGDSVVLDAGAGFSSYQWSNGKTTRSITVFTEGVYTVSGTMAGGCGGTSQAVRITVNATPLTPTARDVRRCGPGIVLLSARSTQPGVTFRWYASPTASTILKESTGDYPTPVLNTTRTYYVSSLNTSGCESERTQVQAMILPVPAPNVTVVGPTQLSTTDSVVLIADPGYTAYMWSTGATSGSIVVRKAGSYTVTVTDTNGCTGMSETVAITEQQQTIRPTIHALGRTVFCKGDSVLLTVTVGNTYDWRRDGLSMGSEPTLTATSSGTYWCRVQDATGAWQSSDSIAVLVHEPAMPMMTVKSDTLSCENGMAWQWYVDGVPIDGATDRMWIALRDGMYSVEAADSNGCTTRSQPVFVNVTAITPAEAAQAFTIGVMYPNPFRAITNIPIHLDAPQSMMLDICDVRGAVVRSIARGRMHTGQHLYQWDGCDAFGRPLPSGRYFIRVMSHNAVMQKPMLLLR